MLIYLLNSGRYLPTGDAGNERQAYDDVYVGYALSFPFSKEAKTVKYRVNEIYIRDLLGDDDQA